MKIESMSPEEALKMLDSRKHDAEVLALNEEGYQLIIDGHLQSAQEKLKKAIEINPRYPTAQLNLGASYTFEDRWSEALPWLESAYEMDPTLEGLADLLEQCRAKLRNMKTPSTHESHFGDTSKKWWQFWK